jgi:hypothetical protein
VGFKEGRLLGWDWRKEERRAGSVSGKRESVLQKSEKATLTLSLSIF